MTSGMDKGRQRHEVFSFSAGPARLPTEVLKEAQHELLCHGESGLSVLEMSHRSVEYTNINNNTEKLLRKVLEVPDDFHILMLQGGASAQFAAVPLNLMKSDNPVAHYVITGSWSAKAAEEAKKYGTVHEAFPKQTNFTTVPEFDEWNIDPNTNYLYFCANETIHGVQIHSDNRYEREHDDGDWVPRLPTNCSHVPLICDASSDMLSRSRIPWQRISVLIASAQKSLGCAGLTLVVVKDSLLHDRQPMSVCPTIMQYKLQANNGSLYNTPPTFAIYLTGLLMNWVDQKGGAQVIAKQALAKATALYDYIDSTNGFYVCPVDKKWRSNVNVVFLIKNGDVKLEKEFVVHALNKYNICEIKGHRSVGGLRASLYLGVVQEDVELLIQCMKDFKQKWTI